mgnify:CR=1 FL=1
MLCTAFIQAGENIQKLSQTKVTYILKDRKYHFVPRRDHGAHLRIKESGSNDILR